MLCSSMQGPLVVGQLGPVEFARFNFELQRRLLGSGEGKPELLLLLPPSLLLDYLVHQPPAIGMHLQGCKGIE
jgi:hypothetical protein